MAKLPLLSDVQSTRLKPEAGERLLVRVSVDLTPDQRVRINRAVKKFVGNDVRILIVNCMATRLTLRRRDGRGEQLVEPIDTKSDIALGVANLDCSVIQLNRDDKLIVTQSFGLQDLAKQQLAWALKEWAGEDVEIIFM